MDCLGFIGGSKGADALIKQHPQPHRLKVFSQLEGKNLGVVFPDADLDAAVKQIILGSRSVWESTETASSRCPELWPRRQRDPARQDRASSRCPVPHGRSES